MNAFFQLLMNPAVLSLIAGSLIGLFSEFRFPRLVATIFSLYLIFTVGFKGGICLGITYECTPPLITLAIIGAAIGFFQTFIHYGLLHYVTKVDAATRAVLASQYGSISIVTFMTAISFLAERQVRYDSFMSAIAGIMEVPALFSGLLLLKRKERGDGTSLFSSLMSITKSIALCPKINMLFVGFFAGYVSQKMEWFALNEGVVYPFTLILVLFMLDIGIKIAKQRAYFADFSLSLILFGIFVPLVNGFIGLLIAQYWVTYFGSALLFAILLASASYIAVPAVMGSYAPNAKPAIYLPMSLGITLPFNILVGIPLFYSIGQWLMPGLYALSQLQ